MLKTPPRGLGAPHPAKHQRTPRIETLNPIEQTPRSARMMEKLREGLGEYVRIYNPVSTNHRRMNNLSSRESGRHTVDLAHPRNRRSGTGGSADLVPPLAFETNAGVGARGVPRLHILHSDSESDDDEPGDHKGSVRSMPNLSYRPPITNRSLDSFRTPRDFSSGAETFRLGLPTDRTLSTISSDEEETVYTSRRENMRQTLKLMGANEGGKSSRTPRQKRLRAPAPPKNAPLTARTDDGNSSDDVFESARKSSTNSGGDITSRRGTNRGPLDVITERQNTEENLLNREGDSPTKSNSTKTSRDGTHRGGSPNGSIQDASRRKGSEEKVIGKRGSKGSLQRNMSRRSLDSVDEPALAPAGGSSVLSKRNSVAALRAKRRRSSLGFLVTWFHHTKVSESAFKLPRTSEAISEDSQMLASKFRRVCRLFIVLYRLWKSHSVNVSKMMENFESLDALMTPEDKKEQLLFDLSLYKTSNEAKIPAEAKAILQMPPRLRTTHQLKYLKTALRNYQVIAEYPVHMQELISQRAWYEGYDQKRVMVREGHQPQNFYFILSGSVVVSRYDKKSETNKTVCFMGRGDAFGELAIINRTKRDATVITKETSQFLVLRDEDFLEIFTSGGLGNPKDPFLSNLWYMKGWPLQLLGNNPKKAVFTFFRRGFVLAPNTNETEWIYIVKSGSLSLYKKLKFESPDATKQRKVKRKKKPKIRKLYAQHEDDLQFKFDRQISSLEHSHMLNRLLLQPNELNIPVNPNEIAYQKTPKLTEENSKIQLEKDHTLMSLSGVRRERSTVSIENTTATGSRRKRVSFSVTGPILTKTNMDPNPPASMGSGPKEVDPTRMAVLSEHHTRYDQNIEEPHVPRHKLPMFVIVQTLTKGSYFGLNAMVYKTQKQPEFSLVSNGAEVIMVDKRFFEEHCNQRLMTAMREQIYPFPMDDVLQDMLKRVINWDQTCKDAFTQTLHNVQLHNASVHDARSTLLLGKPPEMPPRPL